MIEASNTKDRAVIDAVLDEFMALDFVDHHSQIRGRENVKKAYSTSLENYPDSVELSKTLSLKGTRCGGLRKIHGRTLLVRRRVQPPLP
jgi:hypothetical protein